MIKIISKEQCCGCSACLHICPKQSISFKEDKEGFLYPKVNIDTCIGCGLCEKVCPVINQNDERLPLQVYAAKHPNDEIRMSSSSGGIFTLLAEQIIDEGGVVFGAKFNEKWEVVHDFAETKEGLIPFRGSKYVQSRIGDTYANAEKFLKSGRKVMFTGTPCQIAGLKKFLRKEYNNLLAVDFICHGVPSPMVWRKYIEEEIARQGKIGQNTDLTSCKDIPVLTSINFRDKSTGWKKYSFALRFSKALETGVRNYVMSSVFYENSYMNVFLSNQSLRPSCYVCPVKSGKSGADVTIGDFWGVENILPNETDDKGISIVLMNKDMALDIGIVEAVDFSKSIKANPSFKSSSCMPINRNYFFKCLCDSSFYISFKKLNSSSLMSRLKRRFFRMYK